MRKGTCRVDGLGGGDWLCATRRRGAALALAVGMLTLIATGVRPLPARSEGSTPAQPGAHVIERASVCSDELEGNSDSSWPAVSPDGRYVAFQSSADNLVPGDTNKETDIFVRDRETGQTTRVSVSSAGTEANSSSGGPSISADGRYVAFESGAGNLVPDDTNGAWDAFVHDRLTGQTTRVSASSTGEEADAQSEWPSISADGRYVAFGSQAGNLVPGDTNNDWDTFVHDRVTGQTTRVSVSSAGDQGNAASHRPNISADGRCVVFWSQADNLVPNDTNGAPDVFVHDRETGQTSRASVSSDGRECNNTNKWYRPTISGNGRSVAFSSDADNLVAGDTNGTNDIFVHDRETGQTSRVSVSSDGQEANAGTYPSAISEDGRYVAFDSWASNLVAGDTNGASDAFLHDRQTGQTTRVSVSASGEEGNSGGGDVAVSADAHYVAFGSPASNLVLGDTNGSRDIFVGDTGDKVSPTTWLGPGVYMTGVSVDPAGGQTDGANRTPSVSSDGRYVAFWSAASNVIPGDTNDSKDIFRRDLLTGRTVRVSVDSLGGQANGDSYDPVLSADGRYVAFESYASNLVPGDTNGACDIFRKDLLTGEIVRVSVDSLGGQAGDASYRSAISSDGRYVAFVSRASNLAPGDTNGWYDIFRKDLLTGEIVRVSVDSLGGQADGDSYRPSLSSHGRHVVFASNASNLIPGDTNGATDIFRKDTATGEIVRVSLDSSGGQADGESYDPVLSPDARYIAFWSAATNLVPDDTNGARDIFRKDTATGEIVRVSLDSSGGQADGQSYYPAMSSDGRYIAFCSSASNLVVGDTNGHYDVFRKDIDTNEVLRVSVDSAGSQADDLSYYLSLSSDGRYVVFESHASNLVPGDTNDAYDIFLADMTLYPHSPSADVITERVSISSEEIEGNAASAVRAGSVSADGRWVAFTSDADNLVPGDMNVTRDVFVRDRQSGDTYRVSVSSSGAEGNAGNNGSYNPAISSDGRFVSFMSDADNLVPGDMNNQTDIFVHDRQTGETTRASVSSAGGEANGPSCGAFLSADGRYVVLASDATNLVPDDANGLRDVFRHDRQTGETVRMNVSSEGTEAQGESQEAATSGDGRYIVFDSGAANLVPGDTNGVVDIFVHDTQAGETARVSLSGGGIEADGRSAEPVISADGRYVTFISDATNLVPGDSNGVTDVFFHDRQTGETTRVSVSGEGAQSNDLSHVPVISGDGRYVAFTSYAANLVPEDSNGERDVFLHDMHSGSTALVSASGSGTQGNGASSYPSISADGRTVAFWSYASNLVQNDTNGVRDVFARDLGAPQDTVPPETTMGTNPTSPNGDDGWYKSTPSITLTSNEPGTTRYQWDSTSSTGWTDYTAPFDALEGEHTLYYYSVDDAGSTETTHEHVIRVDRGAPSSCILSGSAAGPTQIDISWTLSSDSVSGVSAYAIYDTGTGQVLATTNDIAYSFADLEPGSTHSYQVRARDVAGNYSDPSNTVSVTTQVPNRPPTAEAGGPYYGHEGLPLTLDGSLSSDPDGDELTYAWDFDGDGTVDARGAQPTGVWWNNDYDGTITLTMSDGADTAIDTADVHIANAAPTVDAGEDRQVDEGTSLALLAHFGEGGVDDAQDSEIDWGDGTTEPGTVTRTAEGGTIAGDHAYADNGVYTVKVTVTDDDGGVGTDTLMVTVGNAPPVVTHFDPGSDPFEGQVASVLATFTDAGRNDTHTATIDWGDGTPVSFFDVATSPLPGSHTYADNGIYTMTVTVTDDDGGVGTDTLMVTVGNAPPVVTHFDPGSDPFEGQVASVLATFTDAGRNDTHTATIDWGDGTPVSFFDVATSPLPGSHTYADNGIYTMTVTVTDDDGGVDSDTMQIMVNNVPPTADAGDDQTVRWGDEVAFDGTFADPGVNDTHTATIEWGDGTPVSFFDVAMSPVRAGHAYADPGVYTSTLSVTDKDGGTGTDTTLITVERRPTTLVYAGDTSGQYSDVAHLSATLTDDRGAPVAGQSVTFTLGTQEVSAQTDLSGVASAEVKIDQPAGTKDLSASFAGDTHFEAATVLGSFEVGKEATTLNYTGDAITQRYQTATLKAQLAETDASVGSLANKAVIFTITDGVNTQSVSTVTDANGLASTTSAIALPPGIYNVTASFAEDDFYRASSSTPTPYVIWEPIAGLNINGGGWVIKSGQKTNFGFTAKYLKDVCVPKGELEVIDRASGQNIHAEGFDWLILSGQSMAILNGSARVNGVSGHSFRLIVSDLGTPGKDKDTFELQLDGVPLVSGVLAGGNIVIH